MTIRGLLCLLFHFLAVNTDLGIAFFFLACNIIKIVITANWLFRKNSEFKIISPIADVDFY